MQKEEFTSTKSAEAKKTYPIATEGGGDCAFHAALGKWDANSGRYICKDSNEKRRILADAIRKSNREDKLFIFIIAAIEALIMEQNRPEVLQNVRTQYLEEEKKHNKALEEQWKLLEEQMQKNSQLFNFVNQNSQQRVFKERYNDCLDKHSKKMEEFIKSSPELAKLISKFREQVTAFGNLIRNKLITEKVIEEYAQHISTPYTWLLPVELKMIAYVFNITVIFRTQIKGESKSVQVEEFNPGNSKKVIVQFNGNGHFERVISEKKFQSRSTQESTLPYKSSYESYAEEQVAWLPYEVRCGVCEKVLKEPIVKCDSKDQDNNNNSDERYYHEVCLTSKNQQGSMRSWTKVVGIELKSIKQILSDHGISNSVHHVNDDKADCFKVLTLLLDQVNPILNQEKSMFGTVIGRRSFKNLVVFDVNGELKLGLNEVTRERLRENYPFLMEKRWDTDKLETIVNYAKYTGIAAVVGGSSVIMFGASVSAISACLAAEVTAGSILAAAGAGAATAAPYTIPVLLACGLAAFFSKYKARQFRESLQIALNHFDNGIRNKSLQFHLEVENILKMEFGEGEDGRYIASRVARRIDLSKNEYAFAHMLRAENAVIRKDETIAYAQFEAAYSDAKDPQLKAISLLGLIKLLSPFSTGPIPTRGGKRLEGTVRTDLLNQKVQELNNQYPEIVKTYFDAVGQLCISMLLSVQGGKIPLATFLNSAGVNQLLNSKDLHLIRYLEPHGKICEIIVTFLQGIFFILLKQYNIQPEILKKYQIPNATNTRLELSQEQMSAYWLAREKFLLTWTYIKEHGLANKIGPIYGNSGIILQEIKSAICLFLEKFAHEKIFQDDLINIMINEGLKKSLKNTLSKEEILNIINQSGNENIASLESALNVILSSDEMAKLKFDGNRSWLHYLPKFPFDPKLKNSLQDAYKKVLKAGVSPYDRTDEGYTAFMCIPKEDKYELNTLLTSADEFFGVEEQVVAIKKFLERIKKDPQVQQHFLLLSGPPGVGKTELVNKVLKECQFTCKEIRSGSKEDKWLGQLEDRIEGDFDEAIASNQFKCIFLDEIDAICPEYQGTPTREGYDPDRIVTIIQKRITSLKGTTVAVIGATNYLQKLKAAIRDRAGVPVMFKLSDKQNRKKIIQNYLRNVLLEDPKIIDNLAEATTGWSPRFLKLYTDTVIAAKEESNGPLTLSIQDFVDKFKSMRKTIKNNYPLISLRAPSLKLNDSKDLFDGLIGLDPEVRREFSTLYSFLKNTGSYTQRVPDIKKYTLFYGKPGGGKTYLAKKLADHCHCMIINVDGGKYKVPGSELALKSIFDLAKTYEKAILFIDEIDAISTKHSPCRELLQTELDGFAKRKDNILVVIGATNFLGNIAEPMMSRFTSVKEVPLPNKEQRIEIFHHRLSSVKKVPFDSSLQQGTLKKSCQRLSELSEGFSQRDIKKVIDNAIVKLTNEELEKNSKICLTMEMVEDEIKFYKESLGKFKSEEDQFRRLF